MNKGTDAGRRDPVKKMRDVSTLLPLFEKAWSRETSAYPARWSKETRARGQCAVTALIIQDLFGGRLLRCKVGEISHYWNQLPGGEEIDLTRHQFGEEEIATPAECRTREYVISFPDTGRRYALLKIRLKAALDEGGTGKTEELLLRLGEMDG